jgi:CubicO group peptidase (beta-lactamase class C family)
VPSRIPACQSSPAHLSAVDHLEFAPRTASWAYRNVNYTLLTKIVEGVSHRSFSAFVKERIFTPLETSHTQIHKDNDAFALVWGSRYGRSMLDHSGGDTDISTYMARFPEQNLTVNCLSKDTSPPRNIKVMRLSL